VTDVSRAHCWGVCRGSTGVHQYDKDALDILQRLTDRRNNMFNDKNQVIAHNRSHDGTYPTPRALAS
jgi:hypothetical protein